MGKVRKNWKDSEEMRKAYKAVKEQGWNITQAAKKFGIPRKTLSDRLNGKVGLNARSGAPTKLNREQEESLANYVTYMAERAFPMTVSSIKRQAWLIDKSTKQHKFGNSGPSRKWWRGFRKRFSKKANFRMRRPDMLDRNRISDSMANDLREYFQNLKKIYDTFGFETKPERIFNCDESMIDLNKKSQRVVVPARFRHTHSRQTASHECITIHCAVSAAGQSLPPFIIFSKSFPGGNYAKNGPDNALYGKSESGFMDSELFLKWFKRIFLKYAPSDRTPENPLLLLMDGHVSHQTQKLIDMATQNNVILMGLVPHTTHVCQPLDVAVYKSLKSSLSRLLDIGQALRGALWIAKKDVARILKIPFEESVSMRNIKQGFAKCGVYPFNPNAIDKKLIFRGSDIANYDIDLARPPSPTPTHKDSSTQTDLITESSSDEPSTSNVNLIHSNPLVIQGIICPDLANVFVPPKEYVPKNRKTPLRVSSKARVMNLEEITTDLETQKKVIEERSKVEETTKLVEPKPKKKAIDWPGNDICRICGEDYNSDAPENQILWAGCDKLLCENWTCPDCLPVNFDYEGSILCTDCE